MIYCLTHYEGGVEAAAKEFRAALEVKHTAVVTEVLGLLACHFADDGRTEGYAKTGPVAVAKFELGEDPNSRDSRILRQREVADLVRGH
ncbi:hypothetical protein [Mesorhizobium sp. M0643]|uniref:hypothetical protein n=1 Tax=Mesorhizobium sp. M0643 TaxID=2956978 RepID=UPI003338731B